MKNQSYEFISTRVSTKLSRTNRVCEARVRARIRRLVDYPNFRLSDYPKGVCDTRDKSDLIDAWLRVYWAESKDNEARAKYINRRGSGLVKTLEGSPPHALGVKFGSIRNREGSRKLGHLIAQ